MHCLAHCSLGCGGSRQRPGLPGYRPQRRLIPALPHLEPTCTGQSAQSTMKTFCGTEPPLSPAPPTPLCSPCQLGCSSAPNPRLSPSLPKAVSPSLSPPLLALSGCPISLALACSPSITQSQWQMAPALSTGPSPPPRLLDITHPHLQPFPPWTLGPRDPFCEKISILVTQAPSFPPPERRLHPVPGNVRIPQTVCLEAEKGGQGAWEWLHPRPLPAQGPAQPQTPSISCLRLWPPAINRGSESIFFQNKHQTVTTGPEKHSPAGAVPCCTSHCVPPLPTLPQPAGTGAPEGRGGLEASPEVRQVGGAELGQACQVQPLPAGSAREHGPLLPGQAFSSLSRHFPSPVLSLRLTVLTEVTVTQLLKLWWSLFAPQMREKEPRAGEGWGACLS